MMNSRSALLVMGLFALTACEDIYPATPRPDYAIRVTQTPEGAVTDAPGCPSWNTALANPFDNQTLPQIGCASARNLAAMVENPNDLLEGRTLGPERGVTAVGAIRRYDNNQPRGLIMPVSEDSQVAVTTAPSGASSLTGDITGGAGASSSSSGGSTPAP